MHHVVDRIIHENIGAAVDYQAELAHHDHRGKRHNFPEQMFWKFVLLHHGDSEAPFHHVKKQSGNVTQDEEQDDGEESQRVACITRPEP